MVIVCHKRKAIELEAQWHRKISTNIIHKIVCMEGKMEEIVIMGYIFSGTILVLESICLIHVIRRIINGK